MPAPATVSVKLDPKTKTRLKKLAAARRRSPHWLMREAIAQFVDREELRARFHMDGMAAWAEYQATGLHVTGEEADAWLAQLETGRKAKPPKAHR